MRAQVRKENGEEACVGVGIHGGSTDKYLSFEAGEHAYGELVDVPLSGTRQWSGSRLDCEDLLTERCRAGRNASNENDKKSHTSLVGSGHSVFLEDFSVSDRD
jgi:hypothetical protein